MNQKDYWRRAYKEFIALGVLALLVTAVFAYIFFSEVNIEGLNTDSVWIVINPAAATIVWITLAILFKRRSIYGVYLGYPALILMLVSNIAFSFNIIAVVIFGYLLWTVYRVHKNINTTTGSDQIDSSQSFSST